MTGICRQFFILVGAIATSFLFASVHGLSSSTGSFKTELFHREHALSPYRSPEHVSHREKLKGELERSVQRAQTLNRRLRRLSGHGGHSSTDNLEAIITNQAPYEYLMTISVGTPPQNFLAVADTGSDLTWIQCSPCQACSNQQAPVFDPSLSSTYKKLSCSSTGCESFYKQYGLDGIPYCKNKPRSACEYQYFYGDGSNTTGAFSSESLFLNSSSEATMKDFWFGCSHASITSSGLYDSTDGLVGLGRGSISLPSQLGSSDIPDMFSYCLVNRTVSSFLSSVLVFGQGALNYVPSRAEKSMLFTPILNCSVFYCLSLEGISVDGALLNVNASDFAIESSGGGGTFIDSGTTYTSLTTVALDLLLTTVDKTMPYPHVYDPDIFFELCYNVTGMPDFGLQSKLPSISFKFANSSSWDLPVQNSWIGFQSDTQYTGGSDLLCLAFTRDGQGYGAIFGNYQQQDFHVLYDRINSRLGFVSTDCANQ